MANNSIAQGSYPSRPVTNGITYTSLKWHVWIIRGRLPRSWYNFVIH